MRYFTDLEIACKCGCGLITHNAKLEYMIDAAREEAQVPFIVNSWTRCLAHNKKIGGSRTSSHLLGDAIDINYNNEQQLGHIMRGLYKAGFNRILVYPKSKFVHVDVARNKLQPLHKTMEQG